MSNNEQQQKSFANIISRENYDKLNSQDQFEIDHEIIIPTTYKIDLPDDEVYNTTMILNPLLVDEIFNNYIIDKSIEDSCEFNNHVSKISIKLNVAINDESRKKILNKEYQKYSKKLAKIDLIEDLFRIDKSINPKNNKFINLIKNTIAFDEKIYIDFITEGCNMNFNKHSLFLEWNKIELYSSILEYLKEKIDLLHPNSSTFQQQTTNEPTTNEKFLGKYYNPIFLGIDEENIFFELLEKLNAIDEKGNPKKRKLKPICDAIFNSRSDLKKMIFKYNITEKEYINYLKLKYPNEFKNNRLSSGLNHIDMANEKLSFLLKIHNQRKLNQQQKLNKPTTTR